MTNTWPLHKLWFNSSIIIESIYSRLIELVNYEGFSLGIAEMSRNWNRSKP